MTLRRSITNELRNEAALSSTYAKGQDLYRAGRGNLRAVIPAVLRRRRILRTLVSSQGTERRGPG